MLSGSCNASSTGVNVLLSGMYDSSLLLNSAIVEVSAISISSLGGHNHRISINNVFLNNVLNELNFF
jgi:hypothetical protein